MRVLGAAERQASYALVSAFVVLAAGIVAGGYIYYHAYEQRYRAQVESQLSATAELKVTELAAWRSERLGDASVLYGNAPFSTLVQNYLDHPEDSDTYLQLSMWLSKILAAYQYERVSLLDARGVTLVAEPPSPAPVPSIISQDASEIPSASQPIFQDFYRDETDGHIYLDVMVPIVAAADTRRVLGIVDLRIDPAQYLYPYISSWPIPSSTAETLIVRREGQDVVYLNELRFLNNTALALRIPLQRTEVPAVKAVLGQQGIVEGRDYRNVPVIAAVQAVPDSPWFLVARMDTAEADAPVRERLWQVALLVAVVLAGASASVGWIWWQQRLRIYRERAEAGERLRDSEQRLRRAEAIAHLGHWSLDLHTNEFAWSDETYRILGVAAKDFQPTVEHLLRLVHPDDRATLSQALIVMRQAGAGDFACRVLRAGNELRYLTGSGQAALRQEGEPTTCFGTLMDVTELHEKERELQQRNADLERFTYTVSHDLKSPLVTIKTFLGYLRQDLAHADAERREQDMNYIGAAADRMGQLLDELLDLSRLGRTSKPPVTVTFADLAQEALNLVAGRIAERGVEVRVAEAPITLCGDRARLVEIWQNLLENAVKFMGQQNHPSIEMGAEGEGRAAVFHVHDNGMGIDPRYQTKIFGLFEKLEPRSEGTGIGLALVKRIVELYEGRIWVESAGCGQGATFRFTLPAAIQVGNKEDNP